MIAALIAVLGVVAMLLIDFGWMAHLYRLRKGRFEPSRDDQSYFFFQTDLARVTMNRGRRLLKVTNDSGSKEIPFSQIERLDFGFRTTPALTEEWFNGFDVWDNFKRYQDTINWYTISLVLERGQKISIYQVGQYEPREPLSAWWFDGQVKLLHRFGRFSYANEAALEVLERIQAEFLEAGHVLRLVGPRNGGSASPAVTG